MGKRKKRKAALSVGDQRQQAIEQGRLIDYQPNPSAISPFIRRCAIGLLIMFAIGLLVILSSLLPGN